MSASAAVWQEDLGLLLWVPGPGDSPALSQATAWGQQVPGPLLLPQALARGSGSWFRLAVPARTVVGSHSGTKSRLCFTLSSAPFLGSGPNSGFFGVDIRVRGAVSFCTCLMVEGFAF